jgi:hypothetical protein
MSEGTLGYEVRRCASRQEGSNTYEEACVVYAEPQRVPELASWDRKEITFAPMLVRRMAEEEGILLANIFTRSDVQLYADDDRSRAVMFRIARRCE